MLPLSFQSPKLYWSIKSLEDSRGTWGVGESSRPPPLPPICPQIWRWFVSETNKISLIYNNIKKNSIQISNSSYPAIPVSIYLSKVKSFETEYKLLKQGVIVGRIFRAEI